MFLTFGKAMLHKHNKDADGTSDSPMSGHYSCKAIAEECWMDGIRERHAWKDFIVFFLKGYAASLAKGQTGWYSRDVTEMAQYTARLFF